MTDDAPISPRPIWRGLVGEDDEGVFLEGGRCTECGFVSLSVRPQCPQCWTEASMLAYPIGRRGTLYTTTVIHTAPPGFEAPFGVGYVDLPEGPRIFAHIATDRAAPKIGDPVELTVATLRQDEGAPRTGPLYRKATASGGEI